MPVVIEDTDLMSRFEASFVLNTEKAAHTTDIVLFPDAIHYKFTDVECCTSLLLYKNFLQAFFYELPVSNKDWDHVNIFLMAKDLNAVYNQL